MSSAADNSLKQHIFDNEDGSGRLLRFRSGHAAPPHCIMFYGQEGRVLLSAAADHSVRVFSVVQDQQSREMSQVRRPGTSSGALRCHPCHKLLLVAHVGA
jgi:U3 small nucleolar RNA-associated protein 21